MKNYVTPPITKPTGPELSHYLKESIASFCAVTGVPVSFFDTGGSLSWECECEHKLCKYLTIYSTPNSPCRRNLLSSFNIVSNLGEPYIFTCRMGLVNIAVALIVDGAYSGCFVAGPLIMGKLTESTISSVFSLNDLNEDALSKVVVIIRRMRSYQPKEVSHLAMLLNNCVLASITSNADYTQLNHQFRQQVKISEEIQESKRQNRDLSYPYALENSLIDKLKEGDGAGARSLFADLLDQIAVLESGELSAVRNRIVGIFAVLTRAVAEEGEEESEEGFELSSEDSYALEDAASLDELQAAAAAIIERYSHNVFTGIYSGNSEVVKKTIRHIYANFSQKITLQTISEAFHVNPSYLSMLFKEETGTTFTEYLNAVRVKKAKQLLTGTNISVVDISLKSGFADQSYFTKVFKRAEGCTPRSYRTRYETELKQSQGQNG